MESTNCKRSCVKIKSKLKLKLNIYNTKFQSKLMIRTYVYSMMCSSGVKPGSDPSRILKSFAIPSCKVLNPSSKGIALFTYLFLVVGVLVLASSSLFLTLLLLLLKLNPKGIVREGERKKTLIMNKSKKALRCHLKIPMPFC